MIEFKSFPSIVKRYPLVFIDVAFYMTCSVPPCSSILCNLVHDALLNVKLRLTLFLFSWDYITFFKGGPTVFSQN
jgi:hypothetical protein